MSAPLTQEQAAELAGLTVRHLRRLDREDNPPPRESSGGYPARDYGEWLKSRALAGVTVADDGTVYVYEAERARLTHEQANKTALENAELRADMVRMTVVESYWASLGAACRAKLVSVPSKLGALVADASARVKFIGQAEALIYDALAEIQSDAVPHDIRARAARSRRDDVPSIVPTAAEANAQSVG
jgi:hypothetical protein